MKELAFNMFVLTGNIDYYLLYKELSAEEITQ